MNLENFLAVSDVTPAGVFEKVQAIGNYIASHPEADLNNLCYSVNIEDLHASYRALLPAPSIQSLLSEIRKFQAPARKSVNPTLAWMFPGQGSQYHKMARELFSTHPVFRKHVLVCMRILDDQISRPLQEVIYGGSPSLINQTEFTQPSIFVIEYALAMLFESYGIKADILLGHSIGEYVAYVLAGVIDLENALHLVVHRAKLMGGLPSVGGMLAVLASQKRVEKSVIDFQKEQGDKVEIAVVNTRNQVVLAGKRSSLAKFASYAERQSLVVRPLPVSHAFHSSLMEPILSEFTQIANDIDYAVPSRSIISNVDGKVISTTGVNGSYLAKHLVSCVRFYDCLQEAIALGADCVVELGANATLTASAKASFSTQPVAFIPSLQRGKDSGQALLSCLTALYLQGANVNWREFYRPFSKQYVQLPVYDEFLSHA
jgi:acyl transferase domain-containing protein